MGVEDCSYHRYTKARKKESHRIARSGRRPQPPAATWQPRNYGVLIKLRLIMILKGEL
jgi:hypothetical protein